MCCAKEQLERIPYKFPSISIPIINNVSDIDSLQSRDFVIKNYQAHESIKASMVA